MVNSWSKSPTVFIDRDGVLNRSLVVNGKPFAPRRYKDFKLYKDALPSLRVLKKNKFLVIVVTNQPDIGNGLTKFTEVELMHNKLLETNFIDKIYMCSHKQTDDCSCRKPGIQMFTEAQKDFSIDMSTSWMVGDRWSDIRAGFDVGIKTIFIDHGYAETAGQIKPCVKVANLKSAVTKILDARV